MKAFLIGIGIVVSGGCLVCGGLFTLGLLAKPQPGAPGSYASSAPSSAPASAPAALTPEVSISATDLYAAYKANEIAADTRFRGKVLSVTGNVHSITRSAFDDTVVQLKAHRIFGDVHATLADGQNDRAATLSEGTAVVVVGRCTGMIIGTPMLEDAVIQ